MRSHTKIQMTMRYVHPAEEQKRVAVGKLEMYRLAQIVAAVEKKSGGHYKSHYIVAIDMKSKVYNSLKNMAGPTRLELATSCVTGS